MWLIVPVGVSGGRSVRRHGGSGLRNHGRRRRPVGCGVVRRRPVGCRVVVQHHQPGCCWILMILHPRRWILHPVPWRRQHVLVRVVLDVVSARLLLSRHQMLLWRLRRCCGLAQADAEADRQRQAERFGQRVARLLKQRLVQAGPVCVGGPCGCVSSLSRWGLQSVV